MIQKILDYIQSKVSIEKIVKSQSTNSVYIKVRDRYIRVSDHLILKDNVDVYIVISETPGYYIIYIGSKIYCYTSIKKVGDFIINYIIIKSNTEGYYENKFNKLKLVVQEYQKSYAEKTKKIKSLNQDVISLTSTIKSKDKELKEIKSTSNTDLQERIKRQAEEITKLQEKQKEQKELLKEKDADIKEAIELLQTLSENPDARDYLKNRNTGKIYYLDNFSDDVREFIEELIKEDY